MASVLWRVMGGGRRNGSRDFMVRGWRRVVAGSRLGLGRRGRPRRGPSAWALGRRGSGPVGLGWACRALSLHGRGRGRRGAGWLDRGGSCWRRSDRERGRGERE
jgi:hypothetical protein